MKLKCVINIFGGPGVGKSIMASDLFSYMGKRGMSVEIVPEYAKTLNHEGRMNVLKEDQLYVFAKQHRQIIRLREQYEYLIVDSPLLLSEIYFALGEPFYNPELLPALIRDTFYKYPNWNVFLHRNKDFKYRQEGRYQDATGAKIVDNKVGCFLQLNDIDFNMYVPGMAQAEDLVEQMLTDKETGRTSIEYNRSYRTPDENCFDTYGEK